MVLGIKAGPGDTYELGDISLTLDPKPEPARGLAYALLGMGGKYAQQLEEAEEARLERLGPDQQRIGSPDLEYGLNDLLDTKAGYNKIELPGSLVKRLTNERLGYEH